jgi:hypothetical protein
MKLYDVLGVSPDASMQEVKDAYRALTSIYHPDREGGDTEKMAEINKAYETLSDPEKRKHYDDNPELSEEQLRMKKLEGDAEALFVRILSVALKANQGNPISFIALEIANFKAKAKEENVDSEALIEKYRKTLSRITCSSERNLAKKLIDGLIEAQEQSIKANLELIEVVGITTKLCDNYYYDEFSEENAKQSESALSLLENVVATKNFLLEG